MSTSYEQIRLYGTAPDSIVDGPGLRYSVFAQGCSHHCPGCHNPESQDPNAGVITSIDSIMNEITSNPLITGVTLSGGEPFEQAGPCLEIAKRCKDLNLNVWAYSGYTFEDLQGMAKDNADIAQLLAIIDVLVDGPFAQKLHSYELKWRGSRNQRLIDMAATRKAGKVVLWEPFCYVPSKPSNW